jgi:hypothetical protein
MAITADAAIIYRAVDCKQGSIVACPADCRLDILHERRAAALRIAS